MLLRADDNVPDDAVSPPNSASGPGNEGAGSRSVFGLASEHARQMRQTLESVFDPLGMVAPIVHANLAWWLPPMELSELAARYANDLAALQLNTGAKFLGQEAPDIVQPQADDERFADPAWSKELGWNTLKQLYLFHTRHVQNAPSETHGLSPR